MSYERSPISPMSERASSQPWDHLALCVYCFIGLAAAALALRIQVVYAPSPWTHLLVALPPVFVACILPLRLLKVWLSRAKEAPERATPDRDDAPTVAAIGPFVVTRKPSCKFSASADEARTRERKES